MGEYALSRLQFCCQRMPKGNTRKRAADGKSCRERLSSRATLKHAIEAVGCIVGAISGPTAAPHNQTSVH